MLKPRKSWIWIMCEYLTLLRRALCCPLLILMHSYHCDSYLCICAVFSYVPFFDFLWAYTFIGPFSYMLWKHRTIILRIRQFLWKRGLIKPSECDYEAMCATLVLEQTQAIHY